MLLNSEESELHTEHSAELQKKRSREVLGGISETDDARDCSGVHADEPPGIWAIVILLVVATVGALAGGSLTRGAPDAARFTLANRPALELWVAVFAVLCGYWLAALVVMIRWLWQVLTIFRRGIPWWGVAGWGLVACFTLVVVFLLMTSVIPAGSVNGRPVHLFWNQIISFGIAGYVAAIPGLIGFLALRSLAHDYRQWDENHPPCQILMAVQLRRRLRRLLGTFGLFVTLYVVETAARRQLVLAFYKNATYPQDSVLLIGLIFAAVLALYHISATMAINWRCERLLDEYAPVPGPRDDDISTSLTRRQGLAALLGADSSWQQSFQNGVFVLAPLLTALIGTALPK